MKWECFKPLHHGLEVYVPKNLATYDEVVTRSDVTAWVTVTMPPLSIQLV